MSLSFSNSLFSLKIFVCILCLVGPIWLTGQSVDLAFLEKNRLEGEPPAVWVWQKEAGGFQQIASISNAEALTPPCTTCPTVAAILIDACGTEQKNEFMVINTGSGFNTSNLQIDFDVNNNNFPPGTNDININATPCTLKAGNTAMVTGCPNVISVGNNFDLPPNSLLVLQTSGDADNPYSFSSVCGSGQCVYVVANNCNRGAGAFTNNGVAGLRTTIMSINGCSCTHTVTYDRANVPNNGGANCLPLPPPATLVPPANIFAGSCSNAPLVTSGIIPPFFTGPSAATVCSGQSYTLPPITGTNLSGNQLYFTGMNGTGTSYTAGTTLTFTMNTTLYIYDLTRGCVVQKPFVITVNPPPTPTISGPTGFCTGLPITLNAGTGYSNYLWNGGQTTPTISVNMAGTYSVTVTAANGCTGTTTTTIVENAPPVAAISTTPNTTVLTCTTTSIGLTASGGGTYLWSNAATTTNITASAPGTYVVTVTAGNTCTATAQVVISQNNNPPTATISNNSGNDTLTCILQNINLTAGGGGTYLWSNAATTTMISTTNPGTFTVTVTAANGCTDTESLQIFQNNTPPTAGITNQTGTTVLNCTTVLINLLATGGGTYAWSNGLGNNAAATVTMPGTYTVTVTAANGCTATQSLTISGNNTPPTATITPNPGTLLDCNTTSITLTGGGGGTYLWSSGLGMNAVVTVSAPGGYSLTVTAANGCTAVQNITITQNAGVPIATITNNSGTSTLTCTTTSIGLTASSTPAATGFAWTIPGGGSASTATITASVSGTYVVTVTTANGCTAVQTTTISSNTTSPNASVTPATGVLTCATASINLTASSTTPSATFNWGGGVTTPNFLATTAGTFTVTVTGPNGCTATDNSVISQNTTPPGGSISPATATLTCTTTSTTLTASSPASPADFDWGNGNQTATQIATTAGTFSVTITGPNGCTSVASAVVSQNTTPPTISISPASPQLTCTTTTITLTANSNAALPVFSWNTMQNGASISISTAGNYSVTVTGANGCTNSASTTVTQNIAQPNAAVTPASPDLNCTTPTATLVASSSTSGATFNWGGGNMTANQIVSASGNFVVTVTAPNGCTATAGASVGADFAAPDANVSPANGEITCSNTTLTLTVSSATTGATFNWGGGNTTSTKTVAAAGMYTVTVTGPNGCTATASSTIVLNNSQPNATITPASPQLTCTNPSVLLTANSTTTGATFLWQNGSSAATFFANAPGNYTVTVTGPNGCTKTATANVTQAPEISNIDVTTTQTLCGQSSGTMTLMPMGGGPFTYNWGTQPGTGQNPRIGLPIGSFTVIVTNQFGCTMEASGTISAPGAPSVGVQTFPDTCGLMKGIAHLTISGGATPYNIDWGAAPGVGNLNRTGLTVGSFVVTITDNNGCSAVATASIDELVGPTIQATTTPDFCSQNNGSVSLTLTGDQPPFIINWGSQPGMGQNPRTMLPAGPYEVTVTDAVGCSNMITMTVMPNGTQPTASISPSMSMLSCADPMATLVASSNTAGVTFSWSNSMTGNTIVVNQTGVFTVTATMANGCSGTATATVGGSTNLPVVSISPQNAQLNCTTPTVVLTATSTPSGSFNWGNGNTLPTLTVSTSGSYEVTVTAANGCTATAQTTVTQNTQTPSLTVAPQSAQINCTMPSITLTAASNAANPIFSWSNSTSGPTLTTTSGGTFSVTVTAPNGCTNTGGATISQDNQLPTLTVTPASAALTCAISSVNLTALAGGQNLSFLWNTSATTAVITATSSGVFTVTVTAGNGCTATGSSTISLNNQPPVVSISMNPAAGQLTCSVAEIILTAQSPTPNTTFLWQNGSTAAMQTVGSPGNFIVTATAANACTATATATVSQVLGINTVVPTATNPTCGATDGSISLTINGGTAPFNFDWGSQAGVGQNPRTGLPPGTFTTTVTDANGCTQTATASISSPIPPTIGVATTAAGCSAPNGSAMLTIAGGTAPFGVNWGAAPGSGDNPRQNLPSGQYFFTVSDAAGCSVVKQANVGQTPSPTISTTATTASCGMMNGSILVNVMGGTAPFSFDWGSAAGSGSNPRTGLSGGAFSVTVSDSNGCTAAATTVVASPGAPTATSLTVKKATCGLANGSVTLVISGGVSPYIFNWGAAPGSGTATRTGLPAGNYPLTITDQNGCTLNLSFQILDTPPLSISTETDDVTCGQQNGKITVTPTGGTAPFAYNWGAQPGAGGQQRSGLPTGTFIVTVIDAANCSATATATVTTLPAVVGGTAQITPSTCGNPNGMAFVTPISGVDVFQFQWGSQPGSGENPRKNLPGGQFTVTIVDGNGCTASASVVVPSLGGPNLSTSAMETNCGLSNGSISLTSVGGTQPIQINWAAGTPGSGQNPRLNLPTGSFTVTISDANGCTATKTTTVGTDSIFLQTFAFSTTCNEQNGKITLIPSGGGPGGFTYDWGMQAGNGDNPRTDLPPGIYMVTVSKNPNCKLTTTATIAPSNPPPTATASVTATTCGQDNGKITVAPSGGTPPFSFDWGSQSGGGDNPRTGLSAGVYTVTVGDAGGCTVEASATVTATGAPTLSYTATNAGCGSANGSATLTISGSTTPYNIDWGNASGSGTTTRTGLGVGQYIVTVTGANGCSATISVEIQGQMPFSATASPTATTCGLSNGQIFITFNGPISSPIFDWGTTPGSGSNPRTGLPAGIFSVKIMDASGCSATISSEILGSSALGLSATTLPTTCTQNTGEINLTTNGGLAPIQFNWGTTPGNGQNPRKNLPAGTFFVTATDASGCMATTSATVQNPSAPSISIQNTMPADCGQPVGSVSLTISGGTAPVSLDWGNQSGMGQNPRTDLPSGNFVVTATDANGCSTTASVQIGGTPAIFATTTVKNTTCGQPNGEILVNVPPNVSNPVFDWGATPGSGSNPRIGLPAGIFSVKITAANGCTTTVSSEILSSNALAATASPLPTTCGLTNGQIQISFPNGAATPVFDWGTTPGAGSNPRTGLPAGIFSVKITAANGCTATVSSEILASTAISATASATPTGCGQSMGEILLNISGGNASGVGYQINWGATPGSGQNPRLGLPAGTYFSTISDSNGCTATASATVQNPNAPSISIQNQSPASCGQAVGSVSLTISGGTAPILLDWGNQTGMGQNPRTNLPSGNFVVTATDATGCVATLPIQIAGTPALTATTTVKNATCGQQNGEILVNLPPAVLNPMFDWGVSPGSGSNPRTGLPPGVFSVKITDQNGCTTTTMAEILPSNALSATASPTPTTCGLANGQIQINFSGPVSMPVFDWGATPGSGSNPRIGLPAGNFTVKISDANGCSATISSDILASTALNLTASVLPTACGQSTGEISLTTNGGLTPIQFNWGNQAGTGQNPRKNLPAGTFSVTATDAAGCTATASATVTTLGAPLILIQNTTLAACGQAVGSVSLTISGGTAPVSLDWGNQAGSGSNPRINLPAGNFMVTATDANGCSATLTVKINGSQPTKTQLSTTSCDPSAVGVDTVFLKTTLGCDSLVITTTTLATTGCAVVFSAIAQNALCFGEKTGKITLTATAGVGPFGFVWKENLTGQTGSGLVVGLQNPTEITGLAAGNYSITMTAASGATSVAGPIVVGEAAAISLKINVLSNFSGFSVACSGGSDGQAVATFSNAVLPANFAWSGATATSAQVNGLSAGPLSVVLTDANGCSATASATLTEPPPLTTDFLVKNEKCAGNADGRVVIGPTTGGVGPYLFSVGNGVFGTKTVFEPLAAGPYFFKVEDSNGCRDSLTATVGAGLNFSFALPIDSATIFSGDTLVLPVGLVGATVIWSPPFDVQLAADGSEVRFWPPTSLFYSATLVDSSGCKGSDGLFIHVKQRREIYAPNVLRSGSDLSPNDFFTLFAGDGVDEIEELQVFDRWGEVVFAQTHFPPNDPTLGWDGRLRGGEIAVPTVFVWWARVKLSDGRLRVLKGDLTILK